MTVFTTHGIAEIKYYQLSNKMTAVCEIVFENGYSVQGFAPCTKYSVESAFRYAKENALEKVLYIQGYIEAEGKFNELSQRPRKSVVAVIRKVWQRLLSRAQ